MEGSDYSNIRRYKHMDFIKKIVLSHTNQTVVVLAIFNGLTSVKEMVPVEYQPYVTAVLAVLAILFRIFPTQKFN